MKKYILGVALICSCLALVGCSKPTLKEAISGTWDFSIKRPVEGVDKKLMNEYQKLSDKCVDESDVGNITFFDDGSMAIEIEDDGYIYPGTYKISENKLSIKYRKDYFADNYIWIDEDISADSISTSQINGKTRSYHTIDFNDGDLNPVGFNGTISMTKAK